MPTAAPKTEVCTAELNPLTQTSELLTTTDGADAVEGALSITVFPVVLEDTVFEAVVLLTVFDELLTVLELLLTVLLVVVLVTVSVAKANEGTLMSKHIAMVFLINVYNLRQLRIVGSFVDMNK